ncbi:MAG: hypothetical protein KDJ97_05885 [Anaerolineae bacterium]|nr:hypothetical protein [Anaerolineae bacterium]
MRIVKLSEEIFSDLESVMRFFRDYLPQRDPPGKFRITEGRITQDGLEPGEEMLFSYNGTIYFIAQSATGRLENEDEHQNEYPFYFLVDMDTLRPVEISLHDVEQRYHQETGETKSLVHTRGWPKIENETFITSFWNSLR